MSDKSSNFKEKEGEKNADSISKFIITTLICVTLTQVIASIACTKIEIPFLNTSEEANEVSNYFILNKIALFTIGLQWLVYTVHASGLLFGNRKTEKFYDLTGSLTFISSLAICFFFRGGKLAKLSHRQKCLSYVVFIWAIRLGMFLFTRISNHGGVDCRFDRVREKLFSFWNFWTIQGVWVFITALPVYMVNELGAVDTIQHVTYIDLIGYACWIIGFAFEVISDIQKLKFRENLDNQSENRSKAIQKKPFISTGLWKFSRHPNYFGEILLWFGVAIVASEHMNTLRQKCICFLSPVFVALLLINLSGIPLLEKKGMDKWRDNSDYMEYVKNTPVLIPFFGRRGEAKF